MKAIISSRRLLSLSVPIMFAGIGEIIIEVTDAIFLARYGIIELGAVLLADTIYGVAVVLVLGLVDGIQVLVARRAGEGRTKEIGNTFNQGVYLIVLVGVAVTLFIALASPSATGLLIGDDEVRRAADAFLRIVAFKVVFDGMNFAYSALYVGLSRTRPLIGATVVLAITNVSLDYGLIFGHFGLPRLGIEGAAIASLVAEVAAFLFLTASTILLLEVKKYGLFAFGKWNGRLAKSLIWISSPVVLDGLVGSIRWVLFFVIIERLGPEPLGVSNILYNCYVVLLVALDAFSETTCSTVSNLIGQDKASRLWTLLRRTISLCYLVTAPFIALALLFPDWVLFVFGPDAAFMEGSVAGLRVIALAVLIVIPGEIYASAVAGTGDTVAAFWIELLTSLCILAYAYFAAFSLGLPLEYIWLSEWIGWLVCATLSYAWLRGGKWRRLEF